MPSKNYISKIFPVPEACKIACLVMGYRETIGLYRGAVKQLNDQGFTVVAYQINHKVIETGEPQMLLAVIDELYKDYSAHTKGYSTVICCGAGMGAGIAMCLQRMILAVAYGVYAVAGVSPAESIFDMPLFYLLRKRFKRNGYDAAKLLQTWRHHEIRAERPPRRDSPILMVLGKRDKIVRYYKALQTLHAWQQAGVPVQILTRPNSGHIRTVIWYKRHIAGLLALAENMKNDLGLEQMP